MVFSATLCPVVTLAVDLHATAVLQNNQKDASQGLQHMARCSGQGTNSTRVKTGSPVLQHCVGNLPGRPLLEGRCCKLARGRADLQPSWCMGIRTQLHACQVLLAVFASYMVQGLTVTLMVTLSVKLTSSDTMRCRASADSGAAEEYRSGFLDGMMGSCLPPTLVGYWNSYARMSSLSVPNTCIAGSALVVDSFPLA